MKKTLDVKRHEHKFYIHYTDYQYCKRILSRLMKRDPHQKENEGYFIRSLYFDTIDDTFVNEKLSGVSLRDKYRFRIYEFDQDWVKVERKRKTGMYISKTTAIIKRNNADEILNGRIESLLNAKSRNSNTLYFDFKSKFLKPVLIIDYTRDAYILDYNNIRITFDKDIQVNNYNYDYFNPKLPTMQIQPEEVIIMEVKYNHFLPSWFKRILSIRTLTSSAISKYIIGRTKYFDYDFTYSSR